MTEQGKKWIKLLIPVTITAVIIYAAVHKENMVWQGGVPVTGKLIAIWHKSYEFEYNVSGRRYTGLDNKSLEGLVSGEQYRMRYDSTDVTAIAVDYHSPVYDTAKFVKTYSRSIKNDFFNKEKVQFSYQVDGSLYKRWQYLPEGKTQIAEGKSYVIWYDKLNPQIAYLKL